MPRCPFRAPVLGFLAAVIPGDVCGVLMVDIYTHPEAGRGERPRPERWGGGTISHSLTLSLVSSFHCSFPEIEMFLVLSVTRHHINRRGVTEGREVVHRINRQDLLLYTINLRDEPPLQREQSDRGSRAVISPNNLLTASKRWLALTKENETGKKRWDPPITHVLLNRFHREPGYVQSMQSI